MKILYDRALKKISENKNIGLLVRRCLPAVSRLRAQAQRLRQKAVIWKSMGMLPGINLGLAGLAVVLFLFLLISLIRPYSVSLPDSEGNGSALFAPEEADMIKKIESLDFDLSMFRSRKLFPGDSASGGERAPLSARPEFEIIGIISVPGQSTAVLKDAGNGRQYSLVEGDRVKDYIVKEILEDKIIFEKNGITMEVYR